MQRGWTEPEKDEAAKTGLRWRSSSFPKKERWRGTLGAAKAASGTSRAEWRAEAEAEAEAEAKAQVKV
jgi:hypothetical protein